MVRVVGKISISILYLENVVTTAQTTFWTTAVFVQALQCLKKNRSMSSAMMVTHGALGNEW
jgi:hypothetical protein